MQHVRAILPPEQVNFVVYHGCCSDGMAGALCAYLFSQGRVGSYAAFHLRGTERDEVLLRKVTPESRVLMVDFAYPEPFLLELKARVHTLIVLDHHVSAQAVLEKHDFCYFNLAQSGATLSWEYFFQRPPPRFIRFIEDRDLWLWRDPDSKLFCAAFYSLIPFEFEAFARFLVADGAGAFKDNEPLLAEFIQRGETISQYIDGLVQQKAKSAVRVTSKNGKTLGVVNENTFVSELGAHLSEKCDFNIALLFSSDIKCVEGNAPKSSLRVSLRSAAGGPHDCTALARLYGGGGHPAASGFGWSGTIDALLKDLSEKEF